MCTVTLRQSAIFTILCMALNGYNLAYVLVPEVRRFLLSQPWFVYIPDVHNVTKFVGAEGSKNIMLGLAGGSIFFDAVMFVACCIKSPNLLDFGRLWHYLDLGADVLVGLASANYTRPTIILRSQAVVAKQPPKSALQSPLAQPVACSDVTLRSDAAAAPDAGRSYEAEERSANVNSSRLSEGTLGDVGSVSKQVTAPGESGQEAMQYQQKPADIPTPTKGNPYKVLLEPPTVRQLLHFVYVSIRAWTKFEMLWMYGVFVHHYTNI
ncbi:uncharacterized protein LOC144096918 [Amblyomma americanum]